MQNQSHDLKRLEDEKSALESKVEQLEAGLAQVKSEKAQAQNKLVNLWKITMAEKKKRAVIHQLEVDELIVKLAKFHISDNTSQVESEHKDAFEKEKLKNENSLANLRHEHTIEIDRIKSDYENRLKDTENDLNEKLNKSQINVNSLKDKLADSLNDYNASTEKLKLESEKRHVNMTLKVSNCLKMLSLINSRLFGSDATFSEFIKSLSQMEAKTPSAQIESAQANAQATAEEAFEFDKKKIVDLVIKKRREISEVFHKLGSLKVELNKNKNKHAKLTAQLKSECEVNEKQKAELCKCKIKWISQVKELRARNQKLESQHKKRMIEHCDENAQICSSQLKRAKFGDVEITRLKASITVTKKNKSLNDLFDCLALQNSSQ